MSYVRFSIHPRRLARRLTDCIGQALPERSSGQAVLLAGIVALALFAASKGVMPGTRMGGYDPMESAWPVLSAEVLPPSGEATEESALCDYLTQFDNAAIEQEQLAAAVEHQ